MIKSQLSAETVLDRQCEQRLEPGYVDAVRADPTHRVVLFHRGKALVEDRALGYLDPAHITTVLPAGTITVFLGNVNAGHGHQLPAQTSLVLQILPYDAVLPAWVPAGAAYMGYRDAAAYLSAADAEVFIQAQAVANWHTTHPCCPRCGNPTVVASAGWMRRCTVDQSEHFPRTDPAVIVAIVGADSRILLANNYAWEPHRYSTVAGFAEAGESAEQAAVREIAEEVGVHLHSLQYFGSQAWPFPRSLMLGFIGYTDDVVPTPDNVEVRAARWFTRDELQSAVLNGEAAISHKRSIARSLIEHWYGGPILEAGEQS
ncbi:NAD(+) diphosphatase [Arthrobacter sp. TMN-49]